MDTTNLAQSEKIKSKQLCSEDMADACVFLMENIDFKNVSSPFEKGGLSSEKQDEKSVTDSSHSLGMTRNRKTEIRNTHINVESGEEISIKHLTPNGVFADVKGTYRDKFEELNYWSL